MEVQMWRNNILSLAAILILAPSCLCDFEKNHVNEFNNATLDIRLGDDSPGIHKCCPHEQGLVRLDLDGEQLSMYACTEVFQDRTNGSFNVSLEIPQVPLRTTSIELNVTIGFPAACEDTGIFFADLLTSAKALPSEYCIDKIILLETHSTESIEKGSVVIISCGDKKPEISKTPVPRLRTVRKCCIGDQVYDTVNHTCIDAKNESTSKSNKPQENNSANTRKDILRYFENLFDDKISFVDITTGLLPCLNPSVTYEYSSLKYDFQMLGNIMTLIGDGKAMSFEPESYCIDSSAHEPMLVRACSSPRKDLPLVTKCCPEGQTYMPANNTCRQKSSCAVNPSFGFSPTFYDISNRNAPSRVDPPSTFGIQYTPNCPAGKYILMPSKGNPKDYSYLDVESGKMFIPGLPDPMQPDYCMEVFDSKCPGRKPELYTFNCFPVAADKVTARLNEKLQIFSIGLIISCVFLAATLIVYLALPPLQNLHGRTLMCHVAAMLVAYSCLARVQWSQVPRHYCKILGYAVYFSFLAAFSWLNIMCFDIWWTFGNIRAIRGMQHSKDRRKLLLFSLYAWGVPLILTTVTYLLDTYDVYHGVLDPNIGHSQCWFATGQFKWPVLILFILPVGIQIGCNSILFVLTALHCSKVKSEIHRMQSGSTGDKTKRRFMADKAKYSMNMKLFVVMGITWVTEIISSLYNEPYELWYAADAINVLQGIPIFVILVMKRKVYLLMRKRLGLEKKKKPAGSATTTTGIASDSCTDPLSGKKYSRQFSTSSGFRTNMSGKSDL